MSRNKIVWLDAGHGGRDPGAVGHGSRESDIVLELANRCGAYLLANYENVDVLSTRTTDVFVDLADRTRQANSARADVFVSFHSNAFTNDLAQGFETHIFNGQACEDSQQLQRTIHNAVWDFYRQNGIQSNRGMRQMNLHVLRESAMPAVLTENLFMSNREILNFKDEAFMQGVAVAHAEGIANYLGLTKRSSNNQTPPTAPSNPGLTNKNNFPVGNLNQMVEVTSATLNVRSGRGVNHPVVRTLRRGDRVNIGFVLGVGNSNPMQGAPWGNIDGNPGEFINLNLTRPVPTVQFFPAPANLTLGLVDSLNSIGVDSSLANRQRIGRVNDINIDGSPTANNQMLTLLREGRLVTP